MCHIVCIRREVVRGSASTNESVRKGKHVSVQYVGTLWRHIMAVHVQVFLNTLLTITIWYFGLMISLRLRA